MRHKETNSLFNYWNEIRGSRDAPARSEVSPAALGPLLSSVMLVERKSGGDILFRLAGTRICSIRCRELRGRPFAGMFQDCDRPALERVLNSVAEENALAVLDARLANREGNAVPAEIALFPLEDKTVRILGAVSIKWEPYWFGAEPALLELRGIRFLDKSADFLFLQSRPSVPVKNRNQAPPPDVRNHLRLLGGTNTRGPAKTLRIFTVHEGGKK